MPDMSSTPDPAFPILTPAQIARIATHGRAREFQKGEVLVEAGGLVVPFFVVTRGQIEIVQPIQPTATGGELQIAVHGPGHFTGEANMLSGRRALFRMRAAEAGEAIELDRERLLTLVQTDAELSEIVMRAYILRRIALIKRPACKTCSTGFM
jgi:thioredoxin reductase (NADPH)